MALAECRLLRIGADDFANLLAAEAIRAQQHFLGSAYNANADYMIMLSEATVTAGADEDRDRGDHGE